MNSLKPYMRLVNLMGSLRSERVPDPVGIFMRYLDLLYFICEHMESGQVVTVSELVYSEQFGTYKSIYRRIKEMESMGVIKFRIGKDKRVREVVLSDLGNQLIYQLSQSIITAAADDFDSVYVPPVA